MKIAIIDPVGKKAGIDHYDIQLLHGLNAAGDECFLYSNFGYQGNRIQYQERFHNTGVSKIQAVTSNFTGFLGSLFDARRNKVEWLILHVFRAGVFDLFMFTLARLLGFKILAIIHDIESLDTFTLPFVRKTVIGLLPNRRVVHNNFCREELARSIGKNAVKNTGIIPHVNFIDLFKDYHLHPEKRNALKLKEPALSALSPEILAAVKNNTPLILFFGQIKKAKGVDILLESISKSKTAFKVIIAGKLRNETREKYDSIVTKHQISDRVIQVIRHISDEERDVLFAISSCIVLPYRWIYQSGVLLMTMSFPMTVIASDLPPNADLIRNGSNGLLFKPEDTTELAAAMDKIIAHPEEARQMQVQALSDVQQKNSSEVIGKQYHDFLTAVS